MELILNPHGAVDVNVDETSKQIPQKHISIIVDNAVLIEIGNNDSGDNNDNGKDNAKLNFSINMATLNASFSISDTRISSASSIFDMIWIQSDFERQKKIKQTFFDIFKGLNMKRENYERNGILKKMLTINQIGKSLILFLSVDIYVICLRKKFLSSASICISYNEPWN